ncbi:uncharacterized protein LOC128156671 [Crassostrea angulata]|uniref:uncharacterized protein LOC128156671 n=1 Tax=Magallana angulata TaxID=2784310 RepID=UPI0022B19701|nr:uncharacterized protein LOC128156671 [Crassostrea angulata]
MKMIMASFVIIIWIWSMTSTIEVTTIFYQHSIFLRHKNPAHDNGTSPFFSSVVATAQACINKCHNQLSCESLVYDTISFKCSLFEGKNVKDEISSNQVLYEVVKKAVLRDISDYAKYLCNGNSPGYFYNESVPVCYKIDSQPRSMTDAKLFCGESGGHLLRIDTEIKQKFAENLNLETTSSVSKYRIDGKYNGTNWTFSNDQAITQFYWYPGEPSREQSSSRSVGLRVAYSGKWDDIRPSGSHGCICEKDIKFN